MTGVDIDVAEDGSQAVEKLLSFPERHYALILMDVQMPVMNGYEATEKIRRSPRADAAAALFPFPRVFFRRFVVFCIFCAGML